jgi:hypothetical protein
MTDYYIDASYDSGYSGFEHCFAKFSDIEEKLKPNDHVFFSRDGLWVEKPPFPGRLWIVDWAKG